MPRPSSDYGTHIGEDELDEMAYGREDDSRIYGDIQEEHEAAFGLVQSRVSHRHSRNLQRLSATAQSFARNVSSNRSSMGRLEQTLSRRQLKRESTALSALPPLPDSLRSNGGTPVRSSETADIEKQSSAVLSVPCGPPGQFAMPPRDPDVVGWNGPDDPGNPMNWPRSKKWACTFALGFVTFCVTFASSVFSPGTEVAAQEFGVSTEVMVLSTALFVLGFAFGPVIWGPMSELYGRKIPLFAGFIIFAIFQIPVAVAPNLETIFICRFLSGFAGCAPLTIVGGALADFWAPVDRGIAVAIFSCATFLGPTGGPIVGGYLVQAGFGWRWTAWVTLIASAFFGTAGWFVYPESFGPVLLQQRAKKLRYATKNWAIHAPADEIEINMRAILEKYLTKPIKMLIWEPILVLITIYISFIYGILYLFFETYPISFIQQRGWSAGAGGLPFIAVMVGVMCGGCTNYFFVKTRYVRIMREKGRVPPEERLVPMMVGSVALPVGLFMFAWTSSPTITPWPQIIAGAPVGMGIVLIFLQGVNYIIDVYMMHANSAIAANTIPRSVFGAGFPMFAIYMYRNLGVQWATTVLALISVALIPVPILFFIHGERIRKMSRFVPKLPAGVGPGGPGGPSMLPGGDAPPGKF
ncbi:hypothetical protein LTR85_007694 [Meristemomyces frigidus]|nr:hypothetical protein LTR85_007694 [Meristemomyces frigidus]